MTHGPDIELCGPIVARRLLDLDDHQLLELVNLGRLPAYDLGGKIRFRIDDVNDLARDPLLA